MVVSTLTADPMEDVAAEFGDTPGFFQLYTPTDRDLAASLVQRAEAAGLQGHRRHARHLGSRLAAARPDDVELPAAARALPGQLHQRPGVPRQPGADAGGEPAGRDPAAGSQVFGNPLTWDDLPWLRSLTKLPLLVKGICHPDDARRAIDGGVDGIYCSNHGGRQANGGLPAIDCLPGVVEAADGVPVLFDSGIRSGADIVKALALGRHRRRHRPAVRLRAGARRRRRRRARAAVAAGRGRPDHGRRRLSDAEGPDARRAAARHLSRGPPVCDGREVEAILEEFDEYLALERGRSDHTRRAYLGDLRSLFDFLGRTGARRRA